MYFYTCESCGDHYLAHCRGFQGQCDQCEAQSKLKFDNMYNALLETELMDDEVDNHPFMENDDTCFPHDR
jgi:hypothetical protein